jgi:signal transduction histidine kinase/CheY-like chemotaxis protein
METAISSFGQSTVWIFAPYGRDASIAQTLLRQAEIASAICSDHASFESVIGDETCFVVVTEEALRGTNLRRLAERVAAQPSWSDLPFIVLTRRAAGREDDPFLACLSDVLGNVTFLERPFHPATFISVARTAIKGRTRQYEARARIEELHESQERLRTALAAGRLGSWELDFATWEITGSASFRILFGREPDERLTYANMMASIHPDDRESMETALWATTHAGSDFAVDVRVVRPDNTVRWAELRARQVHMSGSNVASRLVGVSSDVTDRRKAETGLRHLNETLEERVSERTLDLQRAHEAVLAQVEQRERAEEQLRQVQKIEMIGQLTGGVAHDFNNLLMAILGNLELLRKHIPQDPKSARLIAGAMQGAERGATLTQRLLAFARRQDLRVEPKSLIDLVRGMTDLLERSVGSRIELEIDLPSKLPLALVDANQIELALLNLVVNARDAMPDGGKLTIRVDQADAAAGVEIAAGSYVRLIVSDTGQGMNAETLKRATEPFFSTKELGKGTGLGLSMIHGLAVQLNGALRLESEPGRGTVAELWLPVTALAPEPEIPLAPIEREVETPTRMTILVVDDDPLIAMSTVDMLQDLGHEVVGAQSGAQALEVLQKNGKFDLLITDFSMPNMTGVQLAKAARELRPELPILLATGYAELPPGSDLDLPRIGKPYLQEQLAAEISKAMRHGYS